ncbi:MAG: UDP-N-acetylmuramoyl-L-alanine--D-glutamate ligase [Candidatus Riflebacteria bacterium]|nr:UDP-N-acetylmuramoyl-L-alanine--D-glutamate ligase [Candidatus Riflebacteria bacterium]
MDVSGKRVVIIGAAKSGLAAAKALSEIGAKVLLSDLQDWGRLEKSIKEANLPPEVELETGGHGEKALSADFIILSPGVPPNIPILRKASEKGIPILSEIEIAYLLSRGRRFVITGSNGKTTTTTLLSEFCKGYFSRVFLGGNIGIPMMEFALKTRDEDIQVLEVSSFQLETISKFCPDIGLITNFYENHLDRYPSYEAYRAAKERIALNMDSSKWLILNGEQPLMREFAKRTRAKIAWFGFGLNDRPCVTSINGNITFISENGEKTTLFSEKTVKILGRHNLENAMAASAAALISGIPAQNLASVVSKFPGVEHRLEWVKELHGVTYINDSKGTNCAASITALKACKKPIILIAGGRDKGTDLIEWKNMVSQFTRGVILYGEARERFRASLEGLIPLKLAASFADAVNMAAGWAIPGDTVLLSPACSSYDLFPNFEIRGTTFKELVNGLPE